MQTMFNNKLEIPSINDGRFFVSPILGCSGLCSYCYLKMKKMDPPYINDFTPEEFLEIALSSPDFVFGENGTIISIGAWGDIFPLNNDKYIRHSVNIIKALLSWGNPVQIMSKNSLEHALIHEISQDIKYPGQLLYSTTITTIARWKHLEANTASPIERLDTALNFHTAGIPTNVLLKPFMPKITGKELPEIAELLLAYKINYCTLGVMYSSPDILNQIDKNSFLRDAVQLNSFSAPNHLDCNGVSPVMSTSICALLPYVEYLNTRGISTFLKSSCVSANLLNKPNPSNYYANNNPYCINCGNCLERSSE